MNWDQAVEVMKAGATVRRASQSMRHQIGDNLFEHGEEGARLVHAWTCDETAVQVFVGEHSKELFVPEDSHRSATDWVADPLDLAGEAK